MTDIEREVEQRGLYFDELETGVRYIHRPGRTATEADNVVFTTLTMNAQPLHLAAAYAATEEFWRPLMNSMWTLSTMVGLSVAQITLGTLVAQLSLTEVTFPHPLFAGDTIVVDTVILDKRLSRSRPGQGIVTMTHTARNHEGMIVAIATRTALMLLSPEAQS